jgi:hypothetical protein
MKVKLMQKKLLTILAAGWLLAACSPSAPDIDVVSEFDMGSVDKGQLATTDLTVRNMGGGPLTVQSVSTSCGCTKATLSPMIVPAGGEARLHVEYNSGAHEEDLGMIERSIFIASDDPDEEDVQIQFTVIVDAKPS